VKLQVRKLKNGKTMNSKYKHTIVIIVLFLAIFEAKIVYAEGSSEKSNEASAPVVPITKTDLKVKEEEISKEVEKRAEDAKFKGLAKGGVIASIGTGTGSQTVKSLGNPGANRAADVPISGSVQRRGSSDWAVSITNNSKKQISASLRVEQFGRNKAKVKNDTLSVSVPAGKKVEKIVPSGIEAQSILVEVVSWKAK
jgi:hypothetical protein